MNRPVNKAVTERWHREHCTNHNLHSHRDERHLTCMTCGHNVLIPVIHPHTKEKKK